MSLCLCLCASLSISLSLPPSNISTPCTPLLSSMYVVTNLFKIYFRLNTLRLCNNLIVTVERPNFPTLDKFPLAHGVTYKFYTGRLSMFNNDFEQAERSLDYALTHCLRSSTRNRRLILLYLIPVKMIMGKFPHPGLLDKYQLDEFKTICTAVRRGELSAFNESLATHQELFVRKVRRVAGGKAIGIAIGICCRGYMPW